MTRQADQLDNAKKSIEQLLKGKTPILDLALERAESRAELHAPSVGIRGGSSSPEAIEERQETERVIRMAVFASSRLPFIAKQLEALSFEAHQIVQRLTAVVDPAKYDTPVEPGCKSCKRTEGKDAGKIGGHWAAIMPANDEGTVRGNKLANEVGLCRWCADHARANADELGLTIDDKKTWPPVKACDLRHTQSERAAGVWLSKREAKVA